MRQANIFDQTSDSRRPQPLVVQLLRICALLLFSVSCTLKAEIKHLQVLDVNGVPLVNAVINLPEGTVATADKSDTKIMDQVDRTFLPMVVSISAGDAVAFPNSDNIRHHVYSFSPAKTFELKLYSGTPKTPIRFDKPGVVVLGCNIHDSMIGYIYVAKSGIHGVTDKQGKVSINVETDSGELFLWHPSFSINGQVQKNYPVKSILQQTATEEGLITIKLES